ncbi:hypothetical protein Metlim_2370 [Methanoplanus limicola DSM 2279]|uniref:Antitoxin n=2 Tax=Methanoplanus limicola TaxID=2315 RepID=H1Z2L9_9EURY|nr:hypothetical protein Metlim_2370 [Methanoplanus limicola DSM 2279]
MTIGEYMGTKSINVSEEAYERLKTWKQSDEESFTSVILRVLPKRKSILESYREFQRSGKTISDEDADQLIKDLE